MTSTSFKKLGDSGLKIELFSSSLSLSNFTASASSDVLGLDKYFKGIDTKFATVSIKSANENITGIQKSRREHAQKNKPL